MNVKQLEAKAIQAHERGERFTDFFERHRDSIKEAVGHDRQRFAKLYHVLLMLTISGDLDGEEPPGSFECAWIADDEASKPHDTETSARYLGYPLPGV